MTLLFALNVPFKLLRIQLENIVEWMFLVLLTSHLDLFFILDFINVFILLFILNVWFTSALFLFLAFGELFLEGIALVTL